MNDALWALLDDEELALQADQWRYQAERDRLARRWGRAKWCDRMSSSALDALHARQAEAAAAARFGNQLAFTEAEYRRVFEPGQSRFVNGSYENPTPRDAA